MSDREGPRAPHRHQHFDMLQWHMCKIVSQKDSLFCTLTKKFMKIIKTVLIWIVFVYNLPITPTRLSPSLDDP